LRNSSGRTGNGEDSRTFESFTTAAFDEPPRPKSTAEISASVVRYRPVRSLFFSVSRPPLCRCHRLITRTSIQIKLIKSVKFTPLKDLLEHTLVNIVGVIASFREVTRAAHGRRDYTSSVTLCDPTRSLVGTGLLCFFYDYKPELVPQPLKTGEILIAYDVRIKPHGHDIQAWSTHTTKWKLVAPGFDLRTLRPDELGLVKEMHEWWSTRGGAPGARGDVVKRDKEGQVQNEDAALKSKKMSHIGGMEMNRFYDIVCEVVKTYDGYPYALYVTDYTQHTSLFNYEWSPAQTHWKGPFGKYTLQIDCWGTVAEYAKGCKVGGYYLFKNVRAKRNKDGNLEGSLNPDQRYEQKQMIERYFTSHEANLVSK
jgi:protection of telomeres protein 1